MTPPDMPPSPPQRHDGPARYHDVPTLADYDHLDWCHWDMDCCGCCCVDLTTQIVWRWIK